MDQETLDLLLEIRQEGLDAINDVVEAVRDLHGQLDDLIDIQRQSMVTMLEWAGTAQVVRTATGNVNQGFGGGIPIIGSWVQAISGGTQGLAAMGPVGVGLIVVLALLSVALLGIIGTTALAVAGVAVFLTVTAVGFAALAAAAVLALGPIVAIGVAMTMLADLTFTAGQKEIKDQIAALGVQRDAMIAAGNWSTTQQKQYTQSVDALKVALANVFDPLAKVEDAYKQVGLVLGANALPFVKQFTDMLAAQAPQVQTWGLQLEGWFMDRLPTAMAILHSALGPTQEAFTELLHAGADFVQELITRMPAIGGVAHDVLGGVVSLVQLMGKEFLRFLDWFLQRWPEIKPIVEQIMGAAGQAIETLATVAGQVVDWFIANWPEITHTMQDLEPLLGVLGGAMWLMAQAFVGAMKLAEGSVWVLDHIRNAAEAAWRALMLFRSGQEFGPPVGGGGGGQGGGGGGLGGDFNFAGGGYLSPGRWGWSGESGMERLYAVPGGGVIVTPSGSASGSAGGGGGSRIMNVYYYIYGATDPNAVANEVDARMAQHWNHA